MKIKNIVYQYRRDFQADYECSGCGHVCRGVGYDDANFHQNVIPSLMCPECGESEISLGNDYRPLTTKYPEGYQV